jgi:hypothetical protein
MIAPCRFDDDSSQVRVARFGDAPAPGSLATGVFAGHSAAITHQSPSAPAFTGLPLNSWIVGKQECMVRRFVASEK